MLTGLPPHYNEDKGLMFRDIKTKAFTVPRFLGDTVKSLLSGLLEIDPSLRLGAKRGIAEIKEHAFFKEIDWNLIVSKDP
jgi:hypothetical protein